MNLWIVLWDERCLCERTFFFFGFFGPFASLHSACQFRRSPLRRYRIHMFSCFCSHLTHKSHSEMHTKSMVQYTGDIFFCLYGWDFERWFFIHINDLSLVVCVCVFREHNLFTSFFDKHLELAIVSAFVHKSINDSSTVVFFSPPLSTLLLSVLYPLNIVECK